MKQLYTEMVTEIGQAKQLILRQTEVFDYLI